MLRITGLVTVEDACGVEGAVVIALDLGFLTERYRENFCTATDDAWSSVAIVYQFWWECVCAESFWTIMRIVVVCEVLVAILRGHMKLVTEECHIGYRLL